METIFYILYLIYLLIIYNIFFFNKKNGLGKEFFFTTAMLFLGDLCYIIPKIIIKYINLNEHFIEIGNFFHAIIFTMFILGIYIMAKDIYKLKQKHIDITVSILIIVRLLLCIFPINQWSLTQSLKYRIIRNTPIAILMILITLILYKYRKKDKTLERLWLYLLLAIITTTPLIVGSQYIKNIQLLYLFRCMCYYFIIDSLYEEQSIILKRTKIRRK